MKNGYQETLLGENSVEDMKKCSRELFRLSLRIRKQLGKNAHLFDRFAQMKLEIICRLNEAGRLDDGLDAASELRGLCGSIIRGENARLDHPFYPRAKQYIDSHPLPFKDEATAIAVYNVYLIGDFMEYRLKVFNREQSLRLAEVADFSELYELYAQLCELLGDDSKIKRLGELFLKRFSFIPPKSDFIQGISTDMLYNLIYRDKETSQSVFQLILDHKAHH